MSHPNSSPYLAQRPGQQPPSTSPNYHRSRQVPALPSNSGQSSMSRTLAHNANVTSNPSQASQHVDEEPDFWLGNPKYNIQPVTSPGSLNATVDIYSLDEDTSHHEPSFDDYLTTEASSENPLSEHTTPQELIWEQQFMLRDPSQPHILDPYSSQEFDVRHVATGSSDSQGAFQHSEDTLPKFISGQELMSSKSSVAGSPLSLPLQSQTVNLPDHQNMDLSATYHKRAPSQSLKVDTAPNHTPSPNHKVGSWQRTSSMNARSPVVMISEYETSEVKSEHPIPTSAKRSRGSDDTDDDDVDSLDDPANRIVDGSRSYLMPPGANDTEVSRSSSSQRTGIEPQARNDEMVASFQDMEEKRQLEERNDQVQEWLATSDAGSEPGDEASANTSRRTPQGQRRRAHTTNVPVDPLGRVYSDKHIPGPGALLDVETDDEYFDDISIKSSELEEITEQVVGQYHEAGSPRLSPRALESRDASDQTAFPTMELDEQAEGEEPLPNQFIRRGPWQDPAEGPITNVKSQPNSSNAAAYKFNQEAAKWESSSRAATWGTRRRLSESEVNSIVDGSQVRHLSLSKRGRERTSSILNKARGLLPRRSNSNIKTELPTATDTKETTPTGHAHRSSVGSIKPAQRMPSFGKPKSPSISTGSAFLAMTGQLAAVGSGGSVTQEADAAKSSRPLQALKKQRSKSDVSKNPKSSSPGGLADLLTKYGGPPIPTLASPMHEREPILAAQVIDNEDAPADEEEDDTDEVGIKMDLEIQAEDILPTVEGFRDHARKLNPRLDAYLIDRIGQEQVRRYKKLVEIKIKHTRSVKVNQKCPSGKFCFELGGDAKLLAPRVSSRDPDTTLTQFQISNTVDEDVDESGFSDGIVTPALFPPGIPLPPVARLPAEFECNLCFKVKKFQKPSDWTKHVHEDIQPFTCTFPHCPESKSFKRKADWVRHENERHRHLEWWKCSVQECNHICYRKDNFVQHLVREHKMTEPKIKRGSGSSKNKPVNNGFAEDSEVWRMVEDCRFETDKKPKEEACRFCGNVCSTFKKLSVHMGKHMEQIAMPVLQLVNMREVSPDTIVSPIEQPQVMTSSFAAISGSQNVDASNLSPYPTSGNSAYQTSSAGQSPASMHGRPQNGNFGFDGAYYSPHAVDRATQGQMMAGGFHSTNNYMHQSPNYMGTSQTGLQHDQNLSPQSMMVAPRSQPTSQGYDNSFYDSTGAMYSQPPIQQHMYASAHSHSHSMPYTMGQYAPTMLPNHSHGSHSSPMSANSPAGLGLQAPLNQHPQQQYVYGAPEEGLAGSNVHFT